MSAETQGEQRAAPGARLRVTWQELDAALLAVVVALTVAAELASVIEQAVFAAGLDATAIALALNAHVFGDGPHARRGAFAALALVPLARLTSLGMAVDDPVVSLSAAGLPMLVAALLAAPLVGLDLRSHLRQIGRRSQWQLAIAALAVAGVGAALLDPEPLVADPSPGVAVAAMLAVFLFGGVLEELIFRGVLQSALRPVGRWPAPEATLLFACMYLDVGWAGLVFAAIAGAAAAWWVARTQCISGVTLAHGVFAASYLVGWPLLFS